MSILEPALAQKFIDKTAKIFEYNINIMNDKGIIIASKDASRIGHFHEVADAMLKGTLDTGVVQENQKYLGTKNGVNLFINYKSRHAGVIGVSGNPDAVGVFAELMKTFMEATLEYEVQMEKERRRRNKAEQFLDYLLFDENIDMSVANTMADDLCIKKDLLRASIIIKYDSNYKPQKILDALTSADGYSCHDITTIARNGNIIMFKTINAKLTEAIRDYRYLIQEYLDDFTKKLSDECHANKINFFIGSLQENINKYRDSYIHAQELELHIKEKSGIYFFNDYILDYYRSLATIKVYDNIFGIYDTLFNEEEKKQICETIEVLKKNNYNIVNSAKILYIHRNTLLFRLNKIKDILNIDPISNAADREFLNELGYYFSHR